MHKIKHVAKSVQKYLFGDQQMDPSNLRQKIHEYSLHLTYTNRLLPISVSDLPAHLKMLS